MSIAFGGPLTSGVITQLGIRQEKYGKLSGRTKEDLHYLNSKTGWVKLTSGVNIGGSEATAAEYILIGGQIGRFGENAYSTFDGATGKGFRPMPGITGVEIRSINRFGVLKEARVTFNCWDVTQLKNLELLYMRPGFTALLEWGHSVYFTSKDYLVSTPSTVSGMLTQTIEVSGKPEKKGPGSKESIFADIEELKQQSKYNYDGILGLITNFSWSFRPDGGYDCTTTISSIGNIIESCIIDTDVSANTTDSSPSPTTSPPAPEEVQPPTMIETILKQVREDQFTAVFNIKTYYPEYWSKYTAVNGVDTMEILPYGTLSISEKSGTSAAATSESVTWISLKTLCQIINAAQLIDQNNKNIIKLNNRYSRSSTFRTFPRHVSSDPGICIIISPSVDYWYSNFTTGKNIVQTGKGIIGGSSTTEILNIFVNVTAVIDILASLRDQPKEKRTLSNLLLPLLDKLTEALGNVNKFDLHYEEDELTYYIVDRMVKPDIGSISTLQVTGLKSTVTQFNFTSKLSPTTTTMLAISAQASSGDLGLEAEALVAWNNGLKDRIITEKKQKITDTDQQSITTQRTKAQSERETIILKALTEFWNNGKYFVDLMGSARTNYTQYATTYIQYNATGTPAGIIPFEVEIHMEGISGIKIGQTFKINAGIMPKNYDDIVAFLVTGVNHDIKDNKWITILKAQTIIIAEKNKVGISTEAVKRGIEVERPSEPETPKPEPPPTPSTPPAETPTGVDKSKNYIIGDSQTPYIDMNSSKASRISDTPGEASLWQGGKNLSWLKNAVAAYPVSADVNSIIINIGTNGVFSNRDDVAGLVNSVKQKFTNAKLFVVKGSWGWVGNRYNANVTEEQVDKYYEKFKNLGVEIIEPAIGRIDDPHGNFPIYKQIGADIDRRLQ